MPKYNVVNTDNLLATQWGAHNHSLLSDENIENGFLVHIGSRIEGEREIRNAEIPSTASIAEKKVVLVAHPTEIYMALSPSGYADDQFINIAGKPFRVYDLEVGDIFSVADYGITALAGNMPVAGNFIGLADGTAKPVEMATAPDAAFVGEIIDIGSFPTFYQAVSNVKSTPFKWVSIRVQKNG